MSHRIDLDAYFARIGYTGERAPTLETLRALHLLHPRAIAFENLSPLLGWPVRLDPESLEQKLVRSKRGGYCFEQNLLFKHVLESLGYRVRGLAARVLWNQPEDAITARSHMLLRVEVDGEDHLADVGFGGQTLTGPLRLEPDVEQATPHEPFRLVRTGEGFTMSCLVRDTWKTLYRFGLEEQFQVDYEVTNYYLSTNPSSHFKTRVFAARPLEDRRYGLLGNQLSTHWRDGTTERRVLEGPGEVREARGTLFGLEVPEGPEVDAALSRVG